MDKARKKIEGLLANPVVSDGYENRLYFTVDAVPEQTKKERNEEKSWKYGYDKEHDIVIISKDGTLGEVLEVQGLRIGLPSVPDEVFARSENPLEQWWEREDVPDENSFKKIKSTKMLSQLNYELKEAWEDYIVNQWERRENGFWFMCKGVPTYITGSHFFYMQWAKIDIGYPSYRDANRIFWYFWEACKADRRSFGMCYLKNRRSGFSFMASSELVNQATMTANADFGILSMTGDDAKRMFTGKVVPLANSLPFFFQPIRSGESVPKTELLYQVPSTKMTKKRLDEMSWNEEEKPVVGLDSKIDWKTTQENSYDGQKLKILAHDESGKWPTGNDIRNNWRVAKTCLRLGSKIIGKCMMGSTCNKQKDGGAEFKEMYYDSCLRSGDRNKNGQTSSGMYALFIPMEWNYEGHFDQYGYPIFNTPPDGGYVLNSEGDEVYTGVIEEWENEAEGLKRKPAAQNEHFRQFPRTEHDAFRDEITGALFNIAKINAQLAHNHQLDIPKKMVQRGKFMWQGGVQDTKVVWVPTQEGRFQVSWLPKPGMTNFVARDRDGFKIAGNTSLGAFGCDSYDIDGVNYGVGSNGALHGITTMNTHGEVPSMTFFLEYVARPQTARIFFEEVLMACIYYGMPILIENNKPGILRYFKNRGYERFCMLRPDKRKHELKAGDIATRGIPSTGQDIIQLHASQIESYVEDYVGEDENGDMGFMPFNRTLEDWLKFEIKNRTDYDATISSGLAIMAVRKHTILPPQEIKKKTITFDFDRFDNAGNRSRPI